MPDSKDGPDINETLKWLSFALIAPYGTGVHAYDTAIKDAVTLLERYKELIGGNK